MLIMKTARRETKQVFVFVDFLVVIVIVIMIITVAKESTI